MLINLAIPARIDIESVRPRDHLYSPTFGVQISLKDPKALEPDGTYSLELEGLRFQGKKLKQSNGVEFEVIVRERHTMSRIYRPPFKCFYILFLHN